MAPDDFFDDQWDEPSRTQETAPAQPAAEPPTAPGEPAPPQAGQPRQRRERTGNVPRPPSMPNLEVGRLAALAAGIVILLLILVFLARSCGGSSTSSKNQDYVTAVTGALKINDQAAGQMRTLLRPTKPIKVGAATAQAQSALTLEKKALATAQAIKPTKQAQPYNAALISALTYRVNGLECFANALPAAYKAKPNAAGGAKLTPCTQRLLASDVVYSDSYEMPLNAALADASVDARVPDSVFLKPDEVSTVTAAGMGLALQRLKPATAAHGLHGLSLDTVIAESGSKTVTLQAGQVNQVTAAADLKFLISATNGGNFEELDVPVMLTLGSGKNAVTKTATIAQIEPGKTQTVEIGGIDTSSLQFDQAMKLTVTVKPVPGEHTTSNNHATYQIAFSLG